MPPPRVQRGEDRPVGGQAVIEGVMIHADERVVTAVRAPDRRIVVRQERHVPWGRRLGLHRVPVVRGVVAFLEMLVIGMRTLAFSADVATGSQGPKDGTVRAGWRERVALATTLTLSLGFGVGVFFFLPLAAAQVTGVADGALAFDLAAGAVRTTLLLGYLWGISQRRDIRRVFQYHGAEHKSIFALEAGSDLTVDGARRFGRLHPRCGTSFLLIVVLLSIAVFAAVDTAYAQAVEHPQGLVERFLTHLGVLPFVAGLGFELLKVSGRWRHQLLARWLMAPGLWLQRITTKEPTDDQLEVALVATRLALGREVGAEWHEWRRGLGALVAAVPTAGSGGQV